MLVNAVANWVCPMKSVCLCAVSLISLWLSRRQAGERVRVVARVNEEWVEGEREDGSERGMFPMSFVDKVPADIPSKADTTEPSQLGKVCHTCTVTCIACLCSGVL